MLTQRKELKDQSPFDVAFTLKGAPLVDTFVDRPAEIGQLERALLPRAGHGRQMVLVLHGPGGIGKTQLSLEFARRHWRKYSSLFLLDGRTEDSLKQSIAAIAKRIPGGQISEVSRSYNEGHDELGTVVNEVLEWLSVEANHSWLLIFDNVSGDDHTGEKDVEAYIAKSYFPATDHGYILITTRVPGLGKYGSQLTLNIFDANQARTLLTEKIGRSFKGSEELNELLSLLGGLPLAIAQAGAFIKETNSNIPDYIELFRASWSRLTQPDDGVKMPLDDYMNRCGLSTWTVSYEHIKRKDETAANFLRLWAYLDDRDLWFELFAPDSPLPIRAEPLTWFQSAVSNKDNFAKAMHMLLSYSMINAKDDSPAYSMHTAVHGWAAQAIGREDGRELAWLAIVIVGRANPTKSSNQDRLLQQRLAPHVDRCYQWITNSIAETYLKQTTPASLKGTTLLSVLIYLSAVYKLSKIYWDLRKAKKAKDLVQRALQGYREILDPEDPVTLDALNALATNLTQEGRLAEAEEIYLGALKGKRSKLGAEHPSRLETVENLAAMYLKQGRVVGDLIYVIAGTAVPFTVRPNEGRYKLIGQCYLHGYMECEALHDPDVIEEDIVLV